MVDSGPKAATTGNWKLFTRGTILREEGGYMKADRSGRYNAIARTRYIVENGRDDPRSGCRAGSRVQIHNANCVIEILISFNILWDSYAALHADTPHDKSVIFFRRCRNTRATKYIRLEIRRPSFFFLFFLVRLCPLFPRTSSRSRDKDTKIL